MKFEIRYLSEKCIGCGACVGIDSDRWELDEKTGKAILKDSDSSKDEKDVFILKVKEVGSSQEAADNCPVDCIFVKKISDDSDE